MKTKVTRSDYKVSIMFVIVCAIIAAIMALLTEEHAHEKRAYKPSPFIIRLIRRIIRKILEFYSRIFRKMWQRLIRIFRKKTANVDPLEDPLEAVIKEQIKNTPEEDVVHIDELDQFFRHRYDGYNTDPIVITD